MHPDRDRTEVMTDCLVKHVQSGTWGTITIPVRPGTRASLPARVAGEAIAQKLVASDGGTSWKGGGMFIVALKSTRHYTDADILSAVVVTVTPSASFDIEVVR